MRPKQPRKKLSSKAYQALKRYIFERDGGMCVFCGTGYNLTPAHIKRRSQGGHDEASNMVTACAGCHVKFDSYLLELPNHVKEMLKGE